MSSSTSPDINYLSCSQNNWARYVGSGQYDYFHEIPSLAVLPTNPERFAGILKLCDGSKVVLQGLEVSQGCESSVDINNHANVDIEGVFGSDVFQGYQIISVKGGSTARIRGTLHGGGNRLSADIILSQWSDQSYNGSVLDITGLKHVSGRKVKVVCRLFADKISGDNYEKLYWESVKLTAYWWTKWAVRKILHIPVGAKGPSWI